MLSLPPLLQLLLLPLLHINILLLRLPMPLLLLFPLIFSHSSTVPAATETSCYPSTPTSLTTADADASFKISFSSSLT
jgi:hypothetical protein